MLEVPYYSALQQFGDGRYHPMMLGRIGQTDPCPTRSYWWLALAGAAGVAAGYYVAKGQKKGRR